MSTRDRARSNPRSPRLLPATAASLSLLALFALFALVPAGCREILSIEERQYDPSLADGGVPALSCDAYCDSIISLCTGQKLQYSSRDACIGLCSTFPEGTLDDTGGNTLGCRIHVLETSAAMIETSDCAAAGPGGDGTCGTNCDSFCTSMQTVCPQSYESKGDCMTECSPLIECGTYYVDPEVTPDNPSIQCRLYHMSAGAINILSKDGDELTPSQTKHCPHATGETECIAFADPQCP